eukprot:2056179-Prymnesium_polylepis.1
MKKLTLVYESIGDAGAIVLAELIKVSGALAELSLDGFTLNILELRGTKPVTSLDLSNKGLGSLSAIVIGKMLEVNGALTELALGWNEI